MPRAVKAPCGVVRQPPRCAVAPPGQRLVARLREEIAAAAAADVVHHRRRNDLLSVVAAPAAHHLAKASQVAQGKIQPATGELGAARIHGEIRVLLGADLCQIRSCRSALTGLPLTRRSTQPRTSVLGVL